MANRPLTEEQIKELEIITQGIDIEEDRKLKVEDLEAKRELGRVILKFIRIAPNVFGAFETTIAKLDANKFRERLNAELLELIPELATIFIGQIKPLLEKYEVNTKRILISKFWAYLIGLSFTWLFLFTTSLSFLNYFVLHSPIISTLIWSFGVTWILSVGTWIYLWRKFRLK